jgi:hypothetical protein
VGKQNIEIERGKTYDMSYVHPTAMTGGTVYFTVKPTEFDTDQDDSDATIQKTITSFTVTDTTASWQLTDADTYKTPGKYFYDIVFEDASSETLPASWYGQLKIVPRVTNRNTD